jgi:type II secretion system protein N
LRRFVKQRARLLKLLGYPLFAGVVFLASVYYSLPIDRIRDRLERELSQEPGPSPFGSGGFGIGLGMEVRIGEMDLHLLSPGVSATAVQLRPRKPGLGSPIAAPSAPPGAPGGDKDGDKDKKTVKPLFIDRLDVRVPLLELLAGNRVADVEAEAFGGTIRGVGGLGGEGLFVNGQIEQLLLGRIANIGQILPLPMTGALSLTVNFKVPPQKLPAGAPPPRPGAPPTFDMPHASGVLEVQLKDGTLGDGKAKLVVPGDPFLSQGLTFPRLKLGNLSGRLVVDRGRASFDELHTKSADAELWIEGYVELRDPMPSSELHLYVRFKPSAELVKREATIEILNNAMGAGKRSDGSLGFAVQGLLAAPRSRPSKDPPEGVTVRVGTLGQVGAPASPSLRPGGTSLAASPAVSPMGRPRAAPPPAPEPPPPPPSLPPPPPAALPPPSAPPSEPPPSAVVAPPSEGRPPSAPETAVGAPAVAPEPVQNLPSHQRGY